MIGRIIVGVVLDANRIAIGLKFSHEQRDTVVMWSFVELPWRIWSTVQLVWFPEIQFSRSGMLIILTLTLNSEPDRSSHF
jgi:hypothetical protein